MSIPIPRLPFLIVMGLVHLVPDAIVRCDDLSIVSLNMRHWASIPPQNSVYGKEETYGADIRVKGLRDVILHEIAGEHKNGVRGVTVENDTTV
jgi:hypothetical protein